ncbi:hypothetical protein C8N26_1960 [Tenacibaculum lutimaris]|uniref:Uncharacterized protein n=1 Tax=Tenacibaculum lutimaris TaxID=285258 RepID=A0A420E0E0_9FLAO|nr:hypothetical protein [Tenacibaculum lutimaris]RKF03571.1 hypothetical protein C8N26_1960 [Tenacibaculum lutimaris]
MKTITNKLKVALVAVGFLAVGTVSAQSTSDVAKGATAVRLIDNKGTIKYLQSNNGITQIVNTTNDKTTTTWQLGGTLNTATTIGLDGNTFTIDGNTFTLLGTDAENGPAAIADATDTTDGIENTGFTVLVRDEATGVVRKTLASNIFQVTAGRDEFPIANDGDVTVTANGLAAGTSINNVSVYRNGAKLRAGIDYTITADNTITLDTSAPAPNDWTTYAGDIIEIQWVN